MDWRSFKNRGKQETNYGDIALIVNVQFTSGESLKGVVNIEAKRSYPSGSFESIDLAQLERIKRSVPYSHLLLYNHDQQSLHLKFPNESTWKSHMWISPVNSAAELMKQVTTNDSWKLLRISFPFTMFLTARVFWGLDLDFRKDVYDDIIKGLNKIIDPAPAFLGIVNVYYEGQKPIDVEVSENWEAI